MFVGRSESGIRGGEGEERGTMMRFGGVVDIAKGWTDKRLKGGRFRIPSNKRL